jgi:spore germination cell wall hydrolase CwlJ-like protein
VKKKAREAGPARSRGYEDYGIRDQRGALSEYGPMVFGGIMLVMAFAFAGHYMGQNAVAHNADASETLESVIAPSSNIIAKGSLLPEGTSFEIINMTTISKQTVAIAGKGNLTAIPPKPAKVVAKVQIIPASVDLKSESNTAPVKKKLVLALVPPKAKVEQTFKLKRSEKQKVVTQRRVQLAEENCLARAVYFEARSESELGQLAVAKVILNRVKDPEYPKSICGVVYQGSGRRNSCQFSFACDGLPDDVRSASAWSTAKKVAQKALAGNAKVAAVGTATNYHADYVKPKWAKTMKRLIKIGHHIFYEDT